MLQFHITLLVLDRLLRCMCEKIIEYIITLLFMALIAGCISALYAFCIKYGITFMDLTWTIILFVCFISIVIMMHEFLSDLNVFAAIEEFIRNRKK